MNWVLREHLYLVKSLIFWHLSGNQVSHELCIKFLASFHVGLWGQHRMTWGTAIFGLCSLCWRWRESRLEVWNLSSHICCSLILIKLEIVWFAGLSTCCCGSCLLGWFLCLYLVGLSKDWYSLVSVFVSRISAACRLSLNLMISSPIKPLFFIIREIALDQCVWHGCLCQLCRCLCLHAGDLIFLMMPIISSDLILSVVLTFSFLVFVVLMMMVIRCL